MYKIRSQKNHNLVDWDFDNQWLSLWREANDNVRKFRLPESGHLTNSDLGLALEHPMHLKVWILTTKWQVLAVVDGHLRVDKRDPGAGRSLLYAHTHWPQGHPLTTHDLYLSLSCVCLCICLLICSFVSVACILTHWQHTTCLIGLPGLVNLCEMKWINWLISHSFLLILITDNICLCFIQLIWSLRLILLPSLIGLERLVDLSDLLLQLVTSESVIQTSSLKVFVWQHKICLCHIHRIPMHLRVSFVSGNWIDQLICHMCCLH